MRILIIIAQYHPAMNPNVYRWSAIAEHWEQKGYDIHVLCTRRQGIDNDMQINGVWVHRAGQNSLLDWISNLLHFKQHRGETGEQKLIPQGWKRHFLEQVMNYTWRALYWPDGACLWYFPARRRAVFLHQKYKFDAIVSVSLPFTANLIAFYVKKRFPALHWLMDIEDPFTAAASLYINNAKIYDYLNRKTEAQLLKKADYVSVTVENTKQLYIETFKNIVRKIYVNPPLYSLPAPISFFEVEKGKIHLAYFGAFYHPIRTPVAFLNLLQQAFNIRPSLKEKLVIHFFGEIEAVFQLIIEKYTVLVSNIKLHGLVSRQAVAAAIPKMDFLINIGNTTSYHLPSKAIDYLMSGKPIVNICYNEQDTFADFFFDYPLILHLMAKEDTFETEQVTNFFEFIGKQSGKKVDGNIIQKLGAPYQLQNIADNYLKMLQNRM